MELLELNLKGYGKFTNHKITFTPGINVIYGGNETGKSTVHSFICAMFFGLSRGRGRAAALDEYQLRRPWDSPGNFLGSMRFSQDGKQYRIDRCFDQSAPSFSLVCETEARESGDPQAELDELLCGLSEAAFVNSVFIPQMHCETGETLAEELRRYMLNSSTSLDREVDVSRALQILRKKKKEREQEKKKEDAALEEEIAEKQRQADTLREEIDLLRFGGGAASPKEPEEARTKRERTEKQGRSPGLSSGMSRLLTGMLAAAGILSAAGIFLADEIAACVFLGFLTVLFGTMAIGVHALFSPDREEEEDGFSGEQEAAQEIAERESACKNVQEELEQLYQKHSAPERDTEIEALGLAIDRICEISSGIFQTNGGALNEAASGILAEITCGRYTRIVMDETGEVRIHTPSRVLGLRQVSEGTMQQIYFALRMASGELFCKGTRFPVILDEPFAMYDEERLKAALSWLKKSGRQVILFTCQRREQEILEQL